MIRIETDTGSIQKYEAGTSLQNVIKEIQGLKLRPIAAKVNGETKDLSFELIENCNIEWISENSEEGLYILRHSCAHLLAQVVTEMFPNAKPTIGPPIEDGFYYDFEMEPISSDDLPKIEKKMKQIAKQNLLIKREEYDNETLRSKFAGNKFKLEIIKDKIGHDAGSSLYRQGNFVDLCKGPHINNTGLLKWFKLTSTSQAYWRGDPKRENLIRIYGICYATKAELKKRQRQLEEAGKRNHKKIANEMNLYMINELIGKGLPVWLPNGEILKTEIEKYAIETEEIYEYERVTTPVLGKQELFEASGHLPHYADTMYPPMEMDDGTYYLKAMNCPMHHLIYNNKKRSYRELPLRIAEYGTVYRKELSGTLTGLLRVRMLSMNDAHIYCTSDQVAQEFANNIKMVKDYYETFGFENYYFRLSLWDSNDTSKYIGSKENWEKAQSHLKSILEDLKVPYEECEGEAAFYGPKIDVQFTTLLGREESMSTIQLDFAAKERFNLGFIDKSGRENNEVFVIHRAPLSTHERFVAFLTEQWAGNFPTWLSPIQAQIVTISQKQNDYALKLVERLEKEGIRTKADLSDNTIGKKIRTHRKMRPAYMLIIGENEVKKQTVAIRGRDGKQKNGIKLETFVKLITKEIKTRRRKPKLTEE